MTRYVNRTEMVIGGSVQQFTGGSVRCIICCDRLRGVRAGWDSSKGVAGGYTRIATNKHSSADTNTVSQEGAAQIPIIDRAQPRESWIQSSSRYEYSPSSRQP